MGKDQDLILAVRNQDLHYLNKVLPKHNKTSLKLKHRSSSKRINVNYQDGDGMSGLHQAALMGHTEIMELLLENGASVNLKDNKGMIALHYAAWQGKCEPVHILLQWKSPSNEQALGRETPLHLACQHGHFDVVNLLLLHQASPITLNKDMKSPLDLACEFGRYRVVDLLLRSNLCSALLVDTSSDVLDGRTTCLHLAAKNGHSDIIRLLLQAGMNINRSTLQGTCLHEAALFGKTDVVKLLLDCGVDVNKVNSYDQTALDIVNKFTTNRASKEIKQLLKEASFCVQAKAVRDHCNIYDPNSLTFKDGDFIKITEQRQDGMWKGSLMKEGCMAKPGWFPADHVVLIDNTAGRKSTLKSSSSYTTPPLTPDQLPPRCNSFTYNGFHPSVSGGCLSVSSSRSSYGSIGHDEAFPPPPSPTCMSKFQHVNINRQDGVYGDFPPPPIIVTKPLEDTELEDEITKEVTVLPPPPPPSYLNAINSLPNHQHQHVNGKVIVNHIGEHCYVDNVEPAYQNSWDMRSSSPAGSNRNSAASSDSGRGLSTNYLDPKGHHNYVNVQVNNYRLSGQSYESGVSSRQSYHSTSSSSVGSLDRLEESGYSSQINVAELFQAGVPDHEVLRAWLRDLNYEEYYQNFMTAGYDMPTITHMTPQDLTAIGISKPGHRKKLKSEIARLNIPDGIPDFKPNDLYDWLRMLNLEQYYNTLANQGYDNIDYVTDITWEDLEEIGIQRLGHQKKIMLAIDRLKRILSGTKRLSTIDGRENTEVLEPPLASIRWSGERSSPPPPAPPQYNELPPYLKPRRSSSGDSLSTNSSGGEARPLGQPLESDYVNTGGMQPKQPAVVPIKVKRSMSQSATNGMDESKAITQPKMCQSFHAPPDRLSDYSDRENTPTGDDVSYQMSAVSLPGMGAPVAPLVAAKPKPVAMIVAKAKQSSREGSPDIIDVEKHEAERNNDGFKSPVKNLEGFRYPLATNGSLKRRTSENIYDTPQIGPPRTVPNYVNYPPLSMHQVYLGPGSPSHMGAGYGSPTHIGAGHGSPSHMAQVHVGPGSPLHVTTQFSYGQQSGSPRGSQQNSPGGRAKKAPPPPPKRNASLRQRETSQDITVNTGLSVTSQGPSATTSVLSPPPIQQKQQISTPQSQAFVNCVQSLSERFGKKSQEENSTGDSFNSDNEELPPAPPVAMEIIEPKISNYGLLGKSDKTSSGEYMLQQRLKRESSSSASPTSNSVESAFGVKLRQAKTESQLQNQSGENVIPANQTTVTVSQSSVQDTTSESLPSAQTSVQSNKESVNLTKDTVNETGGLDKQRKDSTGSGKGDLSLSSSTSSLDSNTLPFANENVGTIKQRAQQAKPSLVMILDGVDRAPSQQEVGEDNSVFNDNTDTMKRTPNKLPKPQQQTVQKLQQPKLMPKPQQQNNSQSQQQQQQQRVEHERLAAQQQQMSQNAQQMKVPPQYNASVTASYVPVTQSKGEAPSKPSVAQKPALKPALSPKPQPKGEAAVASKQKSGDVLSEIDNMLQGLTDELDAMLEFDLAE